MRERRMFVRINGKATNASEKRKSVRIPEHSQISYKVRPSEKTKWSVIRDISEGGISFFTREFVPKDTILEVGFGFQDTSFYFEAVCKVKWIKELIPYEKYEVGVEFIEMPQKAKESLIQHIKNILSIL